MACTMSAAVGGASATAHAPAGELPAWQGMQRLGLGHAPTPCRMKPPAACPPAPGHAPLAAPATGIAALPTELLGTILELVVADDDAKERRRVVQFVGRAWLAAYRSTAYSSVRLDVGATLRALQQRGGLGSASATAALLHGLAVRLPHAAEVVLCGVPLPAPSTGGQQARARPHEWQQLGWQLGQLLVAALAPSNRLRSLCCDWLPHLPALLAARGAAASGRPGLERLGLTAVPAAELAAHLPLLAGLPLVALGVVDAACLEVEESVALAATLAGFTQLRSLSLGGSSGSKPYEAGAGVGVGRGGLPGGAPPPGGSCPGRPASPPPPPQLAALLAAGGGGAPRIPGVSLPALALVAAAATLPSLQQLELSLTFSKQQSAAQQHYLQRLGFVLRQQRREREAAAGEGDESGGGSRVSVTVHEHVQGDLSAVPVASCSLNLDWDDESNPIEVWQCSQLRRLRIAAQLPLQAGQFRPARLAALQVLEVAGCCHIPAYFAEALSSMAQLVRLSMSDCQLEAVAGVPWQQVLPRLPLLREVSVERCGGAVQLPGLWLGLAGCAQLETLCITGAAACAGTALAAAGQQGWQQFGGQPGVVYAAAGLPFPGQPCYAGAAQYAATIPDCVALLRRLRSLNLSRNGLTALPDALAWCQQLTRVTLRGNRFQGAPVAVAALAGLRSLDLSDNQLVSLAEGPYCAAVEELLLGGNPLLLPALMPPSLLGACRLRRLGLPAWWRGGAGGMGALLRARMPWLLLEYR